MVEPEEVQDSVDEQSFHLGQDRVPQFRGLPLGRFPRNDHIAQQLGYQHRSLTFKLGKRKDVGWTVHGTVSEVQGTDLFIISDEDAQLRLIPARVV